MATKKVTFTLDEATLVRLARVARRLDKPKSQVVREAVREYSERVGRLSEAERLAMLQVFDDVVPQIPQRPKAEVEAELAELRASRHGGGRATVVTDHGTSPE